MSDPLTLPLRDIHLPEPVSVWPPAPGWWFLVAVLVVAVISLWLVQRYKKKSRLSVLKMARNELKRISAEYALNKNPVGLLREISALLRRICISLFPREDVASLTGDAWLGFLNKHSGSGLFANGAGHLLTEAPYRREVDADQVELLLRYCEDWIEEISSSEAGRK